MKSQLNFKVIKNGTEYDMHEMGIWVSSFHIHSPNAIRNKVFVPGMPGAHLASTDEGERSVYIAMQIEADNMSEFEGLKSQIFDLFYNKTEITIIRDLTPDREIKVYQEGSYDINNITTEDGEFELLLTMADPYSYGPEKPITFQSDIGIVENKGTVEADPIFELEVLQPVTFAMISNGDEYNMVGQPIEEGDIPTKSFDRILVDELGTLVGWSPLTAGEVLPGGIVGGNMKTTGDNFEAETFGTNANGWVGPAVKKSFSESLQDFAIDIAVTSRNTQGQTGKLMALFLDASNNPVATMTLIDGTIGHPKNSAVFTVGNRTIMNESGENHGAYNNETVHLNLSRNGKTFVAYVYKETGGIRTGRIRRTFSDDLLEHQAPITQVVLYIAKYKNYTPFPMSFNVVVADKNYQLSDLEIPYIADVGDKITFDHVNENILINGESIFGTDVRKDFGADYFKLKPDRNNLVVFPEGAFRTTGKYRERYR
jgi:hypothetical protein